MKQKIVFLDVDGVLHPFHGEASGRYVDLFETTCMSCLKRLIVETGAYIVVSSSWRNFASTRETLLRFLLNYGLGFDRWIRPDTNVSTRSGSPNKMENILAYVQAHCPDEWVVLDDEDLLYLSGESDGSIMIELFKSRFVRTDCKTGLTESDVERAIHILNSN
jgi:hypothetical protein